MKKFISFAIMLIGMFLAIQAAAQTETKQDRKKQKQNTETKQEVSPQPGVITKSGSTSTEKPADASKMTTAPATSKTAGSDVKSAGQKDAVTQQGMTSKVAAMQGKKFLDPAGNATAAIDKEGKIRDERGRVLGTFTSKGEYLNPYGDKVGYVEKDVIRKADGMIFATIREDGRVYDKDSQYIGTVADDGTVLSSRGVRMGSAPGIDKSVVVLYYFFPKAAPMPEMEKSPNP